jgi:hypothetical protein
MRRPVDCPHEQKTGEDVVEGIWEERVGPGSDESSGVALMKWRFGGRLFSSEGGKETGLRSTP